MRTMHNSSRIPPNTNGMSNASEAATRLAEETSSDAWVAEEGKLRENPSTCLYAWDKI